MRFKPTHNIQNSLLANTIGIKHDYDVHDALIGWFEMKSLHHGCNGMKLYSSDKRHIISDLRNCLEIYKRSKPLKSNVDYDVTLNKEKEVSRYLLLELLNRTSSETEIDTIKFYGQVDDLLVKGYIRIYAIHSIMNLDSIISTIFQFYDVGSK